MAGARRVTFPLIAILLLLSSACRKDKEDTPSEPSDANRVGATAAAETNADPALYQKNDSVRNALLFIGVPEEKMDTHLNSATRGQHGMTYEPVEGKQLDFANHFFALRHTRDARMLIPFLSKRAAAGLAGSDAGLANQTLESRISQIMYCIEKDTLFGVGSDDESRFFATFSEFSREAIDSYTEEYDFSEKPTHAIIYQQYYEPKAMLAGEMFFLVEQDGDYKVVDFTLAKKSE